MLCKEIHCIASLSWVRSKHLTNLPKWNWCYLCDIFSNFWFQPTRKSGAGSGLLSGQWHAAFAVG